MSWLKNIMVKSFVSLAVCVSSGCCARQEQFKYLSVRKELEEFGFTARLDGTYYKERCGDVDEPYSLFISIRPRGSDVLSIKNVVLYPESGKPVFEAESPEMRMDMGVDSKVFYFIEIPDLDIEYQEYRIKFEVWKDGELLKKLEFLFEKDFSSRLTHPWLEKINSA